MKGIFAAILIISLQSAVVAAAVIIIKKIFGTRLNTRVGYLLWALVLFRLIFPVLPSSPLSIFNAIDIDVSAMPFLSQNTPAISRNMDDASSSLSTVHAVDSSNMSTASRVEEEKTPLRNGPAENIIAENTMIILSYIWVAGVLLIIAYLIFVNLFFSSRVKSMRIVELSEDLIKKLKTHTGIRRSIRFVESAGVSSPCVFGVINPVIILPNGLMDGIGDNDLYNILAHEFAHIKHYDLAATWLAYILCAIHWFNPLLWYCSVLIKRDQDLCADAYAMSLLPENEVMGYGRTLLSVVKNTETQPFALITAGINESKSTLKQRIKNIAAFSKKKYKLTLFGILLVVLTGIILGTSGMNYPKTSEERMKFSDNIIMSISSDNAKGFELKIHNKNNLAINNCNLEIYDGNPYVTKSKPIFSNKNFRVSGQNYKSFNLENIDYNNAYIKFNYRIGLAPGDGNILSSSGDIRAFDKTSEVNAWAAASDAEVNAFINEYKINPLAITKIYDLYTIVIFENGSSTGYYELYKDNKSNGLISRKVVGYDSGIEKPPVQMLGGTAALINYSFVNFKINSSALRALGYKMKLVTSNGTLTSYVAARQLTLLKPAALAM
ncbi:M56 family metallopeptidase [Mahella australiensis]|uniref:Peptidase M56 BlaR1 n=1 Tax=Mahella australiensis (strain DSM 15567 / CIP 107919 / 50-1 BON) TaxID=697281 RepID=F3ZX53_MAHA5|nr:M56 family metallopeptidase [Mahella australiensis]AEE95502.1 peptidase M56 BlaR1 [Mahella australiensis 50-1 BON]